MILTYCDSNDTYNFKFNAANDKMLKNSRWFYIGIFKTSSSIHRKNDKKVILIPQIEKIVCKYGKKL